MKDSRGKCNPFRDLPLKFLMQGSSATATISAHLPSAAALFSWPREGSGLVERQVSKLELFELVAPCPFLSHAPQQLQPGCCSKGTETFKQVTDRISKLPTLGELAASKGPFPFSHLRQRRQKPTVLHVENGALIKKVSDFPLGCRSSAPSFSHLHFSEPVGKSDITYISILSIIKKRGPSPH